LRPGGTETIPAGTVVLSPGAAKEAELPVSDEQPKVVRRGFPQWIVPLSIFLATLAVCIFNSIAIPQAPTTLIFDSQQYQWTTTQVGEVLRSLIRLHPNFEPVNNPIFQKMIMLDGPVLPVFHALVLACIGKVAIAGQWQTLVWVESIFHAISAVIVFYICKTINSRYSVAVACAALWALYPPAVIASARYLSENLTVLASLFLVLALTKCFDAQGRKLLLWAGAIGITAALIVLLKPALAPGAAAAMLLCIVRDKTKRWQVLLPMLVGAAIIITPWAAYTKAITGKVQITAQRYPGYNLAIGCNTEVHSWCTMPHDSFTELMQDDGAPFAPVVSQWSQKPLECAALIAEKIHRLYAHPWNDFRKGFLGINAQAQYAAHWAVLLLGAIGFFGFLLNRNRFTPAKQQLALALMLLGFSQCTYVLFEGVARYSFTVMPLLVLFAAFVMKRQLLAYVLGAAAVLFICFPGAGSEYAYSLPANSVASKTIDLSRTQVPSAPADCLLLVDGDQGLDNATVFVNGHAIVGQLLPFHYYDANLYNAVFYNNQLAWAGDMPLSEIRTWRAIPIARQLLKPSGSNQIEIKAAAKTVLYASNQSNERSMPASNFIIPDKVCNSAFDFDPRVPSPILCGNVKEQSIIDGKKLAGSLRIRLAFVPGSLASAGIRTASLHSIGPEVIRINKHTWKSTQSAAYNVPIADPSKATHLRITLKGSLRSISKPCKVSALVSCKGTGVFTIPLWKTPRFLTGSNQWSEFVIEDVFPVGTVKPTDVEVLLCPGEWQKTCFYGYSRDGTDAEFKDLQLSISPETSVNATNRAIYFY
jgi:hypothetical protein